MSSVNMARLKEVCNIPVEDRLVWESARCFSRQLEGFRTYSDFVDGTRWLVTNDGFRSKLFYSNDALRQSIDYVLAPVP